MPIKSNKCFGRFYKVETDRGRKEANGFLLDVCICVQKG